LGLTAIALCSVKKAQLSSLSGLTQRTKEKAPSSLAFGSSRETLYRGGGKNLLRSSNSRLQLIFSASLGYAATGF